MAFWGLGGGGGGGKRTLEPSAVGHGELWSNPGDVKIGDKSMLLPYVTPHMKEVRTRTIFVVCCCSFYNGNPTRVWVHGVGGMGSIHAATLPYPHMNEALTRSFLAHSCSYCNLNRTRAWARGEA